MIRHTNLYEQIRPRRHQHFLIVLGIFSAAFGIKGFLLSSRFIDGGVTGVSMLIAEVAHLPLSILLVVINLPFIILGYKQIG